VHSVFGKINYGGLKTQQLMFGTGIDIWWVTEPHWEIWAGLAHNSNCDLTLPTDL